MTRKGLIVFAREPLPGRVKTRLASSVGDSAAVELYEAMLRDVLAGFRNTGQVDTVVFWDCAEDSLPVLAERYGFCSRRQSAGNLGQRMHNAFCEMFGKGFDCCCIIGSDCPDLPPGCLTDAYELLTSSRADAVFGPSADGGYYLLGMRHMIPQLFENITWGTDLVLRESLEAARAAGAAASLLKTWQDIDTVEDLRVFIERNSPTVAVRYETAVLAGRLMAAGLLF